MSGASTDFPGCPDQHVAFLRSMSEYSATLNAIGTPDALRAADALVEALNTMSNAMNLAAAAMIAALPTAH